LWHKWERREMPTGFWWGNMMEGDNFEDVGLDGGGGVVILKLVVKEWDAREWTGFF
jgi:hypothetical protein